MLESFFLAGFFLLCRYRCHQHLQRDVALRSLFHFPERKSRVYYWLSLQPVNRLSAQQLFHLSRKAALAKIFQVLSFLCAELHHSKSCCAARLQCPGISQNHRLSGRCHFGHSNHLSPHKIFCLRQEKVVFPSLISHNSAHTKEKFSRKEG